MKRQRNENNQNHFLKKDKIEGITLPNFKTYSYNILDFTVLAMK